MTRTEIKIPYNCNPHSRRKKLAYIKEVKERLRQSCLSLVSDLKGPSEGKKKLSRVNDIISVQHSAEAAPETMLLSA